MILSLLGLSVYDTKSRYINNTKRSIQEGEYINSIDVLLHSFSNEKFIFLGTKESIKKHKEKFKELVGDRDVEFKEYENGDLNDIFIQIMNTLITYQKEDILFDITHSFRDSVIMSVISTMISQIIYKPNIAMIYAKELPQKDNIREYQYELVGESFLNTANVATILSTFLSTLKVPPLNSKYKLYQLLHDFSTHLVSNQFKDIYKQDIVALEAFINDKKDELFFVKPLLKKLKDLLEEIKKVQSQKISDQFFFFSNFFIEKDYFLHSSTYLIEAITYYIGEVLTDLKYIDFEIDKYENQTKLVALLKLNYKESDFYFPNPYFVDINIDTFNKFYELREKVANIRHNLAHININQNYEDIKKDLEKSIAQYQSLVKSNLLYNLDKTENHKRYTVKYQIEELQKKANEHNIQKSSPAKISKIFNKYNNGKLDDLTQYDIKGLEDFCKEKQSLYNDLIQKQKKRELVANIDTDNLQLEQKVMPNKEIRTDKKLKKPPIVQTDEDKELLKEGASKLADVFNNR